MSTTTPPRPTPAQPGLPQPGESFNTPLPGNTASVTDPAVAGRIAGEQISNHAVAMQRASLYSGQIEANFKAMANQSKEMNKEARRTAEDVTRQGRQARQQTPGYRPTAAPTGPAASSPPGASHGRARDPVPAVGNITSISDAKQYGAARANQWMSQWGEKYRPDKNAAGEYLDEAGNATRASARAGADWERGMSRIGRTQGAINAFAGGEGMSGALTKVAGKYAGPLALTYAAATATNNKIIDERKTNAAYQNIYGGSNIEQYGQRAQEAMFSRFGTLGVMGSGEAAELFKGVSSLGLQGKQRQGALDFATSQYKKTGMDVSASLALIDQATRNGTTSMSGLSAALADVSEAAKVSGLSLKDVQAGFIETYKATSKGVTTTPQSASVAAGLTKLSTQLGLPLQDVKYDQLLTTTRGQTISAGLLNMGLPEFQTKLASGEGNVGGRAIEAMLNQAKKSIFTSPDGAASKAKSLYDEAKKRKGGAELTDDEYSKLGNDLFEGGEFANKESAMAVLSQYGQMEGLTPANLPEYLAKLALGQIDPKKTMDEATKSSGGFGKGQDTQIKGYDLRSNGISDKIFGSTAVYDQNTDLLEELGLGRNLFTGNTEEGDNDAAKTYLDSLHTGEKGARRSASVEGLLKQKMDPDSRFQVMEGGKAKSVTLEEAIKSYTSQLETGDVQITAGKSAGQTVGNLTGVRIKPDAKPEEPKSGTITVSAVGDLERFIKIQNNGGAGLASARANGVPLAPYGSDSSSFAQGE